MAKVPFNLDNRDMVLAFAGSMTGAFGEAAQELARKLRGSLGPHDFEQELREIEVRVIRTVENAALDGISEEQQVLITEHVRTAVRALFAGFRTT